MPLAQSTWKRAESVSSKLPDFLSFFPDQGIAVNYTLVQVTDERYMVWGCWYREQNDQVVFTALKHSKSWRKESYEYDGEILRWRTPSGTCDYIPVNEREIPEDLIRRGIIFAETLGSLNPPETNLEGEQVGDGDAEEAV
jgi:hypothetical protein